MMPLIRSRRGQSTAEYAVLFAIVIGAAIAMQSFISGRLKGAMNAYTEDYSNAAGNGTNRSVTVRFVDSTRSTNSNSRTNLTMRSARNGLIGLTSSSNTRSNK